MHVVLDLPPELEAELADEAAQLGLSLSEYVIRLLVAGRGNGPAPKTGAELLDYWQKEGLVGTRSEIADSQTHARALRERAQKRERD